jgi:hypothetical protein
VGGGVIDPHAGHVGLDALGQAAEDVVGEGRRLALGVGLADEFVFGVVGVGPGAEVGIVRRDLAAGRPVSALKL